MRQAIVRLMNIAFESFLSQKGLRTYELSGGRRVFYFSERNQTRMTQYNRKFKILSGKHFDKTWHYGISIRSSLQPFPNFILKSHIIFTRGDERPTVCQSSMLRVV